MIRNGVGAVRRAAAGFSLVEAMIAMVIVGLLGTAVVSLLMTQGRFYSRVDEEVAAQQSLRAAADLASAELRMSGPTDILAAEPESVTVRFDVFHAVVCEVTGANTVALFVYDSAPNPYVTSGWQGTAFSGPYVVPYEYADGWTGSTVPGAKADCIAAGAPDTTASLYRYVTGWLGAFSDVPPRGSIVRRYRPFTYEFAPSAIANGMALYRGPQELVGPLDASSVFAYVMDDGTVQASVAAGDLDRIRAVRINAVAVDDDPRFDLQRSLRLDVPLRN